MPNQSSGSTRIHIGLVVEIIHKDRDWLEIGCKNMSKSGNYGVSQDRGAGEFLARRDANVCSVENQWKIS